MAYLSFIFEIMIARIPNVLIVLITNSFLIFTTIAQKYYVTNDDQYGFIFNECNDTDVEWKEENNQWTKFDYTSLLILGSAIILCLLILGLKKALLGLCFQPIGQLGIKYIRPFESYERIGPIRLFCLNLIFFFLLPCLFCCTLCCRWEDKVGSGKHDESQEHIIVHQTKYTRPVDDLSDTGSSSETDSLLKTYAHNENETYRLRGAGIADNFDKSILKGVNEQKDLDIAILGKPLAPDIDSIQEVEEEEDTSFVLSALTESRDSLKMLDGPLSQPLMDPTDPKIVQADKLVQQLQDSKVVFRIFNKPISNIKLSNKNANDPICYSIKGYFIPITGQSFQFITNLPLRQYWTPDIISNSLIPLFPPVVLLSRDFSKIYQDKLDVFNSNDLVLKPNLTYPCLNMRTQSRSNYQHSVAGSKENIDTSRSSPTINIQNTSHEK